MLPESGRDGRSVPGLPFAYETVTVCFSRVLLPLGLLLGMAPHEDFRGRADGKLPVPGTGIILPFRDIVL
ncbi:MAG: hypothetical protein M0Z53_07345 [Thermaerobacter sp.]|nr:hypothetical protein [Thermaerobacter sp.]